MNLINKYQRRIDKINEFKNTYINYLSLVHNGCNTEQDKKNLFLLREKLSYLIDEISYYVRDSGVASYVYYSPPPLIGGIAGNIDLLANLFSLDQFEISPQRVIDILNKSIGNTKYQQKQFLKKLLNPVYWIGEAIRIPFHLLRFAGFNANKVEISLLGKIYKLISPLIMLLAAILAILNYFGFDTSSLARIIKPVTLKTP